MPRNFYRRVEVMFPVLAADLKARILTEIVPAILRDNSHARELRADGTYARVPRGDGQAEHRCQYELLDVVPRDLLPPPQETNGEPPQGKKSRAREKARK